MKLLHHFFLSLALVVMVSCTAASDNKKPEDSSNVSNINNSTALSSSSVPDETTSSNDTDDSTTTSTGSPTTTSSGSTTTTPTATPTPSTPKEECTDPVKDDFSGTTLNDKIWVNKNRAEIKNGTLILKSAPGETDNAMVQKLNQPAGDFSAEITLKEFKAPVKNENNNSAFIINAWYTDGGFQLRLFKNKDGFFLDYYKDSNGASNAGQPYPLKNEDLPLTLKFQRKGETFTGGFKKDGKYENIFRTNSVIKGKINFYLVLVKWLENTPTEISATVDDFKFCHQPEGSAQNCKENITDTMTGTLGNTNLWQSTKGTEKTEVTYTETGMIIKQPPVDNHDNQAWSWVILRELITGDFSFELEINEMSAENATLGVAKIFLLDIKRNLTIAQVGLIENATDHQLEGSLYYDPEKNLSIYGIKKLNDLRTTPIKVKITRKKTTLSVFYNLGFGYLPLMDLNDTFAGPILYEFAVASIGPDYPTTTAKFSNFKLTCPE